MDSWEHVFRAFLATPFAGSAEREGVGWDLAIPGAVNVAGRLGLTAVRSR